MYELDPAAVAIGFIITWSVGLAPPLYIRYGSEKRPLEKLPAIGICALFWLINTIIFTALGSNSKTHFSLTLVAVISYAILRAKITKAEQIQYSASLNEASGDGTTPLMIAAMLGKLQQLKKIISEGANVNAADERGWTPLMHAAHRNEVEVVEVLLSSGANEALKNNENQTAVDIAKRQNNIEVVSILESYVSAANIRAQ